MGTGWDEVRTIWDLWDVDTIEEIRRDNAGNSLFAARILVTGSFWGEASAAISFESTNMQSPYLLKINKLTGKAEKHRWYTVMLLHGMVIDILESDEVVPLPEFIYTLKMSNLMIDPPGLHPADRLRIFTVVYKNKIAVAVWVIQPQRINGLFV